VLTEPEVTARVHRFLLQEGLGGESISRLFTDPHPTLTGIASLKPFQRFVIGQGDFVVHPDLLCQQVGSESLVAIEAKGPGDILKGIGQAQAYQRAVQVSLLAAPAAVLNDQLVQYAISHGVGILAVEDDVKVVHLPEARRPLDVLFKALLADLGLAAWMSTSGTFVFNVPTHYLVWVAILASRPDARAGNLHDEWSAYPMPKDARGAVAGARKLGLLVIDGADLRLTDLGRAVAELVPKRPSEWAAIHRDIAAAGAQRTLAERSPELAAVLRILLLQDPLVRHVVEGLRRLPAHGGSAIDLARACSDVDSNKSIILFLKPESVARYERRDAIGIDWSTVHAEDFRSTTFFQYKSILRHAGILARHALGASSASRYRPSTDRWELGPALRG
jgi:antitoxin (DNA-binding transcriptional repressor) of toxin-antitoxin stability system